ncbi:MAG TPA: rod shape-determining protein RodA [Gammaproteobacteria bacterium]|nr:rod shape-determining protein RodA [Gammaproteobacteria bacterium]
MRLGRSGNLLVDLHIDAPLVGGALLLCAVGLSVLYSASDHSLEVVGKQAARMALGFASMIAIAQLSPLRLARWSPVIYAIGMVLLIATAIVGTGRGAHRWLELGPLRFQPSEIMKLAVPLTVAWFLSDKLLPPRLSLVAAALLLVAVPGGFIIEQPDLGTAILVMAAGLLVLFFAGISWRLIGLVVAVCVVLAPIGWFTMHDYQRQRIITLLDPSADPLGAGYHIIQATIAVGSGGWSGKGWLNGTQSHLEFLPERATDFIFAVYCEEFGLLGVLVLLAAYLLVLIRGITIAMNAQDGFSRLIAASLVFTLFIYIFVNMGMVTGQLPVVGVPLPLISYGGTSLVTIMTGLGILMSIQTHRRFIVES